MNYHYCDNCLTETDNPWRLIDEHHTSEGCTRMVFYFCGPACALEWVRDTSQIALEQTDL